jgi:hypothetical protein
MEMCRRNKAYWIDNWVYFYEPRNLPSKPALIPVVLYPRQKDYLNWIDERRANKESGIAEKTRGAGLTYLSCAYALHSWLFEPGFKAAFGSRVEDLVDRSDDPDCIFEKLRIILRHLPGWMLPSGFKWTKHNKFMRLVNPANDSVITGEGGDSMGRGGRNTVYFVDEAAYIARADIVDAALVKNTNTVIYVSTPPKDPTGNSFVTKRNSGKYSVFTFTYQDNLSYSQKDYEKDRETLDPVVFAREINLDYSGGTENLLIPAIHVDAAIQLGKLLGLDKYNHEEYQDSYHAKVGSNLVNRMTFFDVTGSSRIGALDVAYSGNSKNVFGVREGICLILIESWRDSGTTETAWRAIELCQAFSVTNFIYDNVGVGAGIAGVLESADYRFEHAGFNGNYECTNEIWDEFGGRESKEIFKNLRAECAWRLRLRFEKTYEFIAKGKQHPLKELIAVPYHSELRGQLSSPKFFYTDRGQIRVESKKEMLRRGIKSPDFFDMCMMLFTADELGFDYLDALVGNTDLIQLAQLHGGVPINKLEFLKASISESIHLGHSIRVDPNDYPVIRDILLHIAASYADSQDSTRWMFTLSEIKRLDAIKS